MESPRAGLIRVESSESHHPLSNPGPTVNITGCPRYKRSPASRAFSRCLVARSNDASPSREFSNVSENAHRLRLRKCLANATALRRCQPSLERCFDVRPGNVLTSNIASESCTVWVHRVQKHIVNASFVGVTNSLSDLIEFIRSCHIPCSSIFRKPVLRPTSLRPTLRLRPHPPEPHPPQPRPPKPQLPRASQSSPLRQPPAPAVIPAGTILRVRLVQSVGSKISVTGQSFLEC